MGVVPDSVNYLGSSGLNKFTPNPDGFSIQ